jgi:hypothetical protein
MEQEENEGSHLYSVDTKKDVTLRHLYILFVKTVKNYLYITTRMCRHFTSTASREFMNLFCPFLFSQAVLEKTDGTRGSEFSA